MMISSKQQKHGQNQERFQPPSQHNPRKTKSQSSSSSSSFVSSRMSNLSLSSLWSAIILLLLLLLSSMSTASAQEFNFEVERRILDRLDYYMGDPVAASTLIENFRTNDVFANDMKAADRDLYLRIAFGLSQPLIYYALEDGTIPGFYWANGYYREPGNSGYSVDDPEMEKHLKSCVNGFTGGPIDCILPQGSEYISCMDGNDVDDIDNDNNSGLCSKTALCPNQPDCRLEFPGDIARQQECMATLKYCRQYTIETNFATDESRGFLPLTNFCINNKGQFSETIAGVIDPRGADRDPNNAVATCTHGDGSIVQRNLTGSYAACGGNNNNNDEECSHVFRAGYESFEYDPRYRPWYIDTKTQQKPLWTPPYPFFTLGIGVTYTRPIYETDQETGRQIFAGVLSVDYRFDDITNFLIESYGNTTTAVVIYETEEPNYLIATSTGSDTVTFVLDSDETKPCPVDRGDDVPCSPVRVPVYEFTGSSPLDAVLVNAARAHADLGYPKDLLSIKGANDEGFFVSQSTLYEQVEANLSWRVIIVAPGAVSEADRIVRGDQLFVALVLIGTIGVIVCFAFFCVMYVNRTEKAVIFADWRFTCAFIFGCILLNGTTYTLLGENTDSMCLLRMWSFHLCFAIALAPLFVKIWRIKTLVGRTRIQRNQITNVKATLYTLPMILGQAVILLIFTFVDPPQRTEVVENINGLIQQSFVCDTETNAFMITSLICEAGFVLVGCILAYSTRHMNDDFGEAKQLIFAMYNVAFVGCMTVLITQVAEMDVAGQYTIQAIGIFWGTTLSAAAFVVPRIVQVQQMTRERESSRKTTTNNRTPSMLSTGNVRVSGFAPQPAVSGISGVMHSIEEEDDDGSLDSDPEKEATGLVNGKDDLDNTEDTKASASSAHSVDWTGIPKPAVRE